ncbi:MAG: helix-turn-helix transcriptional regulator [Acetobacteraceae bacterium]|jgi:transcriptional regulator with XRE-family HTH domain
MTSIATTTSALRPVGDLLREWRQRRRMSQLDLACEAEISTKHLSFLETGRSTPSREMVLHLAEQLDVPLRARNALLNAAGYAPVFSERQLDDPAMAAARQAIDLVLAGHEPHPALAVDRHWCMAAANRAVAPLMAGVDPELLRPPVNVLRVGLHPGGLAPRTVNLAEWRAHLLAGLRQQIEVSGDPVLVDLLAELRSYDGPAGPSPRVSGPERAAVAVPFRLATDYGVLSFLSTITVFGTPIDVTLSELALECFYPADQATAEAMRQLVSWGEPAAAK